jgi:hypothetical protein
MEMAFEREWLLKCQLMQVEPSVIEYAQARFEALGVKALPAGFKVCEANFLKPVHTFKCTSGNLCTNDAWCTIDRYMVDKAFSNSPNTGCVYAPAFLNPSLQSAFV